jgi:hypothetical protein
MSGLTHRDPTVILTDYTNWAKWFQQLKAQCAAYRVWDKIDPKQAKPTLAKPIPPAAPAPGLYQLSIAATNIHTAQYREAYGEDAIVPPYTPTKPSDLSQTGKTSYKEDLEHYKTLLEEYKIQN